MPSSRRAGYSPYEQATIDKTLRALDIRLDPGAEGKIIESVEVVRLEVIEQRDPAPELLNMFHATSRDFVIRREALMKPGDRYLRVLADETARNLRQLQQLSLVVVLAATGKDPDRVRMVIITKDVWSLRLSWDLALTSGGLENFLLAPQETNLFGLHHVLRTQFTLQPESYTLGAGYRVPRFGLSWVGASAEAGIVMNRQRSEPEGYSWRAAVARPLYSTRTEWAWGAQAAASQSVARRYSNARLYIDPQTKIPFEYKTHSGSASASATRSFGWAYKNDLSAGYGVSTLVNRMFDLPGVDPAAVADFQRRNLPIGETRSGPFVQWRSYTTNFMGVTDFQTLGLQEDYRLGHDIYVQVYPNPRALGATRDLLGAYVGMQYTWALLDGLVRASAESKTELQLGGGSAAGTLTDASLEGNLNVVTPRLGIGRLVFNTAVLSRYENYLNRQSFLGGSGRLRGYPSNAFAGKDFVVANLEFRSRPVEILSCQVGVTLFYDMGDAVSGFDKLRAKQSLGGGLRVLLPQLNRAVFRGDVGFPIDRGPFAGQGKQVDPVNIYVAFEQAFGFGGIGP